MSWQTYVDNLLQYPGVNAAALVGLDGSVWASSPGFSVQANEISSLVPKIKSEARDLAAFNINGKKYMRLRILDGCLDGKAGGDCVSVAVSTQVVVIAANVGAKDAPDSGLGGQGANQKVNAACVKIRDYLAGLSY